MHKLTFQLYKNHKQVKQKDKSIFCSKKNIISDLGCKIKKKDAQFPLPNCYWVKGTPKFRIGGNYLLCLNIVYPKIDREKSIVGHLH